MTPIAVYSWYLVRRQLRPVLIWGASLGILAVWTIAYFPTFSQTGMISEYLDALPEGMKAVFNLTGDLSTIQGWVALEVYNLMVPLALPFYAMIVGSRAVAGAEQQRRLDLILSAPLRRSDLILATAIEMVAGIAGILGILALCTWVPAQIINSDLTVVQTLYAVLNTLPMILFFGGVALVGSTLFRRPGSAVGLAGGLLGAMYFMNGFGQYVSSLADVRKLSVFYHYGSAVEHGIKWGSWLVILVIALSLIAAAIPLFNRRDIYT